jgi:hypothetical protein
MYSIASSLTPRPFLFFFSSLHWLAGPFRNATDGWRWVEGPRMRLVGQETVWCQTRVPDAECMQDDDVSLCRRLGGSESAERRDSKGDENLE